MIRIMSQSKPWKQSTRSFAFFGRIRGGKPKEKSETRFYGSQDQGSWGYAFSKWMIKDFRIHIPSLFSSNPRVIEFSPANLTGHASFIFLSLSYVVSDILWLRSIAILAGFCMACFNYWHPHGRPLLLPLRWNVIFIGINAAHVMWLVKERNAADHISDDAYELFNSVFLPVGMNKVQFNKLLRRASWEQFESGEKFVIEGSPSNRVMLVLRGTAEVTSHGHPIYSIGPGQFVGENGLHCGLLFADGLRSTASVTANDSVKCLVWKRGALIDVLAEDWVINSQMQQAMSSDLLRKLSRSNVSSHTELSENSKRNELDREIATKQGNLYFYILQQSLKDGHLSRHERCNLDRFRRLHNITDEEHFYFLSILEWSPSDYERGIKSSDDSSDQPALKLSMA